MPDGVGELHYDRPGSGGIIAPAVWTFPAKRGGREAIPGRLHVTGRRPSFQGSDSLPRILSWRHGARNRRFASDRMDRTGRKTLTATNRLLSQLQKGDT